MRALLLLVAFTACKTSAPPPSVPSEALGTASADSPTAMCAGQGTAPPADTPRTGPMELQLAPAFLDQMPACRASEATIPVELVDNVAGAVDAKGDCAFRNGVVCHFHLGVEFVDSNAPRPNLAELHCMFPVANQPKSPNAFGVRFACKQSTLPGPGAKAREGAACGAGLIGHLSGLFAKCDARCCDAGTPTEAVEARRTANELDLRPNFRICSAPADLDCNALAHMVGRSANAPTFGPPIEGTYETATRGR